MTNKDESAFHGKELYFAYKARMLKNFDGAGTGICLIWYLRYEDGLEGGEVGMKSQRLT